MFPVSFIGDGLAYDIDAQAFFDRVTTAGGTLSLTEKSATNQLVLDMKSAGIWTSMKAIYPMVGASAAACAQNLVSSSFTGNFSSGWTFASTGVTPNGTSAYMNTSLIPSNIFSSVHCHLSYYSKTDNNTGFDMGGETPTFELLIRYNGNFYSRFSNDAIIANGNGQGHYIASSISGIGIKGYKNGSNVSSGIYLNSLNTRNIYIGATNNLGTAAFFGSKQCAFASIGDGLTSTQAANFYTNVQAFQTTLGRQV